MANSGISLLGMVVVGVVAFALAACAKLMGTPIPLVDSSPELRPGDRWVYEWKSGKDSGTKTVEMIEIKEVNKVQFYVVKIDEVDHYYYTRDLHWAASVRDSKVESRMVPPQPWFVWPLEVGRKWTHRGTFEGLEGKTQHNDGFAVIAAETVEVPAGRFRALKVVRETDRRDSDLYWYAPEVRWYVKWIGRRGEVEFQEQLREYRAAPRLIPEVTPTTPSSRTR